MKSVLVRNGNHQRPMLAVLERYNIGQVDKYNRGRWISTNDLPLLEKCMANDSRRIKVSDGVYYVPGTNQHNYVGVDDFRKVFENGS